MADTAISDLAALTGANLASTDEFVVVDKSDTTMSVDGTDKRMTAAEVRIGVATFFSKVRQALTDKTSFSGTGSEQWGTEEATVDDASLPGLTNVTVDAQVVGKVENWSTTTATLFIWVEISLDGGATWSSGDNTSYRRASDGNATDRWPAVARHLVTGTVTGDIQARAMSSCSAGASTAADLLGGSVYMDVVRSAS